MKFRDLLFAIIASTALIACGQKQKSEAKSDDAAPQRVEFVEVVENGNGWDASYIVISKENMTLRIYDSKDRVIHNFPIAVGKNYGNKQRPGDMKTPEGVFMVQQIQNSSSWSHDFNDGKGVIPHAYGDWFIRLKTPPHSGIGIHGTHDPNSIGTRATEGCIRLRNEDLNRLRPLVKVGMRVTIKTSKLDLEADGHSGDELIAEEGATEEKKEGSTNNSSNAKSENNNIVPSDVIEHTLESGQYLSHVAVMYNTTTARILELNPGINPNKIRVGQTILVQPNSYSPAPEIQSQPDRYEDPNGVYHTIESGDNFYNLAKKYETSFSEIESLNPEVDPSRLQIGQRIRIK
jgi:lipoprotein-anchoring transpeptidase ErfK/SrfK